MKVAILDDYQEVSLGYLRAHALPPEVKLVAFRDHVAQEGALIDRLSSFDAVCRMRERTPFTRKIMEQLPNLKLILCTGLRNSRSVDLEAADELGITVCSTGSIGVPTLELTWGLILNLFRNLHSEAASVRAGGWQLRLGSSLENKTLSILGLGRYGTRVAKIGQAFGMETIAWSPNLTQERAASVGVTAVSKVDLFKRADVVTIHMPESARSINIVGRADIALMKETAFLVNTSRPGLVEQEALIDALRQHRIGGAGVDVFEVEPLPLDHPYRHLPNVLATPHIGYVTEQNYEVFFRETAENIASYRTGKPIRTLHSGAE